MRFIVDAQLPRLLSDHLMTLGHDAMHVKELPGGEPHRLLRVTTGNIGNADLLVLFTTYMLALETAFVDADRVDMSAGGLLVYPREPD